MTFFASFIGRNVGAIGTFYRINTTVEASSSEEARLRLYDRFEHLTDLKLTPYPLVPKEQG